jgi:DNA-binding response OmpR family regulator
MPTALIVEDEPEANELLAMLVRLRGYATDSAFTGGEALEKAGRIQPDVVFLDLMLPDISGLDVCRSLKEHPPTSGIPVVMVTARLAAENRAQGFRAGAADYVPKPYTPDQIFGALTLADAWKRGLFEAGFSREIPLEAGSDVATLREISRLRGQIARELPLEEDRARQVDHALDDLAHRALAREAGLVATLRVRGLTDRVELTLDDASGWFAEDPPLEPEGLGSLLAASGFDEVRLDESHRRLELTLRFAGA